MGEEGEIMVFRQSRLVCYLLVGTFSFLGVQAEESLTASSEMSATNTMKSTVSEEAVSEDEGETSDGLKAPKNTKTGEDFEKISVVGSRIRRLDVSGPSPVHVITREDIEKSGSNSISGILRDSSLASFGINTSYPGNISVRGLGSESTLVLLNGKRLPKSGSFYGIRAPSVNSIPLSAVERVEILSDGASAVYGSEALASVINIVTRKDLNGVAMSTKASATGPEGGNIFKGSATYGKTFSRGYFNASIEYLESTPLFTRSLNYIDPYLLRRAAFSDNYSTSRIPNTPFKDCSFVDEERGNVCSQDYGHINRRSGSMTSGFSEVAYKISSNLTLKADVVGRWNQDRIYGPAYMRLTFDENETLPLSWKQQLEEYNGSERLNLTHQISHLERISLEDAYVFGSNIGLEGDLGEDWAWSLNQHLATRRSTNTRKNMILIKESKEAIKNGQYKPFEAGQNTKDTTGMLHNAVHYSNYLLNTVDLSADGSLLEWDNISLSAALGAQYGYHSYSEGADESVRKGNVAGLRGVNGSGERTQWSSYLEFASLYSDWLELQLATRYDHYSDFGSTLNPKLAMRVQATPWLAFRGSTGTGFRAPELADINTGKAAAYLEVKDHVECQKNPDEERFCADRWYPTDVLGKPQLTGRNCLLL